ncbi:hippurate hydrolase [Rhizobiales bacterium GAS113]|nr:hippurate hydrolase [Rhizobiales bacterium GAS113]
MAATNTTVPPNDLVAFIRRYQPELVTIRRDLHENPELGFEEVRTANVIEAQLKSYGVDEVHRGLGKTGVVGLLRGRRCDSGRSVGLRADMDAVPVQEDSELPYRSKTDGTMHACGHDGHIAMLLGAARYLAETRNFNGIVYFYFQPGEEGHAGARAMIHDGLFERFPVDSVYALHNWPSLPAGAVGLNAGPMMAGIDVFKIRIKGVGGHGGHPHQGIDPIVASAHMLSAIQSIISRSIDPLESAVISFHYLHAGAPTALSVIPDTVECAGMVKWYSSSVQAIAERRLREVVAQSAALFGASAEIDYDALYPPTINTAENAEQVMRVATQLLGAENVERDMKPSMGSEDFAFMLEARPGAYFRLGTGGQPDRFLHSPRYDFNDDVIPIGAAVFGGIAEDALPL